jgi:hypothetical protein
VNALDLGAAKGNLNRTLASVAALAPAAVDSISLTDISGALLDEGLSDLLR